jgi:replicative DNA helicase
MSDPRRALKSNFASAAGLRVPPQNIDSERALLGAIMLRKEVMYDIIDIVPAESFYAEKHRIIFTAMMELFTKGSPIDLLSLSSRLKEKNELAQIGGAGYLSELVSSVPSAANAVHYAEIVHKKFMMRRLIEASVHISDLGYQEADDIDEILDEAEKKMYEVTNSSTSHKFIEIANTLEEAWERIDNLHKNKESLRGVPTGFKSLDDKLSGFQKSDLIILAARPSVGKTSLMLDIARQTAIHHKTAVGIFSLEMGAQQLADRMLAAEAKVDLWKLRTGRLREEDFEHLGTAMSKLSEAPIYIDDQPGQNILKMRSVARRLKSQKKLDLIIVDYLQLMVPSRNKAGDSLVQQVTEISRSLKNLARELDLPVLALSQLSRDVEKRGGKPRLSDLRDSGSIEQDADIVAFIHRDDKARGEQSDRPNIAEILIEKHRNGPTGKVELYFDETRASYMDMDKGNVNDWAPEEAEVDDNIF